MRFDVTGFTCEHCGWTQKQDVACPRCGHFENWTDDLGIHESKAEVSEDLDDGLQLLMAGDPLAKRYFLALHRSFALISPRQRAAWFDRTVRSALRRVGMPLGPAKPAGAARAARTRKRIVRRKKT